MIGMLRSFSIFHSFGREEPSLQVLEEYDNGQGMIKDMVSSICGNLPLALRVLGRSLFNASVHEWRKKYEALKSHGDPFELEEGVNNILKSSYESLSGETQTAFLLACVCCHDFTHYAFRKLVETILPRAKTERLFALSLLERQSFKFPDGSV
ncbi:hypothetical protein GOP47_0029627 [Adiantum capillus-veneris]|nr:hypothetical protein GOP47_0029627 [Adiantum capillus-veneris]